MLDSPPSLPTEPWTNRRILLLVALATLIVTVIWHIPQEVDFISKRISEIVFALVIALACTYLLRPWVNVLQRTSLFSPRRHGARMWATLLVFAVCGLLMYLFIGVGTRPIRHDVKKLWGQIAAKTPAERAELMNRWKAAANDVLGPEATREIEDSIPGLVDAAKEYGLHLAQHSFTHLGFIVELILIPVLVFYFLTDGAAIRAEARLLFPPKWRPRLRRMADDLDRVLDGYIRGQVIMCVIAWILVTLGLLALGIPHAFTLGLIAGLTRAIPVVGPLLGAIPLILVCLIMNRDVNTTVLLLIMFTLMHFLESKVLLPKIVGHEVDLHPVSVILALLLGMEFFGVLGVFLAVPIAAVGKILLDEWQQSMSGKKDAGVAFESSL